MWRVLVCSAVAAGAVALPPGEGGAAPAQEDDKPKPGKVSAIAGTSGTTGVRFAEVTPRVRTLPGRDWASARNDRGCHERCRHDSAYESAAPDAA